MKLEHQFPSGARLPRGNYACVRVQFPDGCRHQWRTDPGQSIARNPIAFAHWLTSLAEEILEGATTEGKHARKSSAPPEGRDHP